MSIAARQSMPLTESILDRPFEVGDAAALNARLQEKEARDLRLAQRDALLRTASFHAAQRSMIRQVVAQQVSVGLKLPKKP